MNKIFTLLALILISTGIFAQENNQPLYLLFEFMQVDDENNSEYWEVEQFWTEIHKQRIADDNIVGWDLWQLTPAGTKQGSQYMTTTLYKSMEAMLQGMNGKFNEYVKKAYPSMSEEELNKMFEKTTHSRDMAHQVYCKEISTTSGDFEMKVGTVMQMDIMKQLDDSYTKMENEIFKPWHQEQVDKGTKGNWGLVQIMLPNGSEAYATHFTYNMYNSAEQLAKSLENWGGDMDLKTSIAVREALKTRDWKEVKLAQLVMMVR